MNKLELINTLHNENDLTKKEATIVFVGTIGRGWNAGYPAPPAQIPACAINAQGSYIE